MQRFSVDKEALYWKSETNLVSYFRCKFYDPQISLDGPSRRTAELTALTDPHLTLNEAKQRARIID
jgi:hypothetical protein